MVDTSIALPILTSERFTKTVIAVAQAFQVQVASILIAKRGKPRVAAARLALYTLLYEQTDATLVEIGKVVGGRHHTTVLDGIQRAAQWETVAPAWHQLLQQVVID